MKYRFVCVGFQSNFAVVCSKNTLIYNLLKIIPARTVNIISAKISNIHTPYLILERIIDVAAAFPSGPDSNNIPAQPTATVIRSISGNICSIASPCTSLYLSVFH